VRFFYSLHKSGGNHVQYGNEQGAVIGIKPLRGIPSPYLTVHPESLDFPFFATQKQQTFSILSNTSWTISNNESWMTVSPTSGSNNSTVTVTVADNTSDVQRMATIYIIGKKEVGTRKITVTQDKMKTSTVTYTLDETGTLTISNSKEEGEELPFPIVTT